MSTEYSVLQALQEGVCVLDEQGRIDFCNRRLEQWLKRDLESLRGQSLEDVFPRFAEPHIRARMQMVKESRVPVIFSPQIHGYLFPCPLDNGEGYRLQQTSVTCLDDDRIVLSVLDFTQQIQQAQIQKESHRRLKDELTQRHVLEKQNQRLIAAMDQAAEAVMICNDRGQFQYVNQAFVEQTGWSKDEAMDKGLYSQLRTDGNTGFEHLVKETLRSCKKWQGHHQVQRKDGTSFTANMSIAPIVGDNDYCSHVVVIQEDMTEYILLEEQYRRTQKQEALTTLVGGIAHDFNNLLSGMLGHIYLASREVKDMPKTAARLNKIQKSAYDAADVVKQLMTFSRRDQIDARNFPLQSFLKEMVKLVEHSVPENIQFSLDFEPYPFPMHGDPDLLQQAVLNMVQNAVEACAGKADNPMIRIALNVLDVSNNPELLARYPALQYGEYADLAITDNGSGIHPDHVDRIFDPFFTTKQLGSGLGLSTVMGCVRHHHGVIDVDSKLGEGTTIHLYLPLNASAEAEQPAVQDDFHEVTVLLVDDDPMVRETSAELLRDMGHEVMVAVDGQDAVEVFQEHADVFDVIMMDMVMPRLNGPGAVRKIREIRPDIPVIFATAYDRSVSLSDAAEFSRATLIAKPFNPEDLSHLLTRVLQSGWQGDEGEDD